MRIGYATSIGTAVLVLAGILCAAEARGDGVFSLTWNAPEECPSRTEVEAEIAGLLGGVVRERDALSIEAVAEHNDRWSVSIETASQAGTGHRRLQAETCKALASATALIVALMIDPDAVAARAEEPSPPPPLPVPPPLAPSPSPTPAPPPSPRRPITAFIGLGGAIHMGALPSPDFALGASGGIARSSWRLELAIGYDPARVASDPVSGPQGPYGQFQLVWGAVAGCLTRQAGLVGAGICGDAEVGAVRAEGAGSSVSESHTKPWLAAGVGALVDLRLTRGLFVVLRADALVPLLRPSYTFNEGKIPVFRPWVVGLRATTALELRF